MSRPLIAVSLLAFAIACFQPVEATVPEPTPPSEVSPPPSREGCGFEDAAKSAAVLVTVVGDQLVTVDSAGRRQVIHQFGSPDAPKPEWIDVNPLVQRGEFAAANAYIPLGADTWGHDLVLVNGKGEVVWRLLATKGPTSMLQLSLNGTLALNFNDGNGLLVHPDGSEQRLPGLNPIAAASSDGWVPVTFGPGFVSETSWYHPVTKELRPFGHPNETWPSWVGEQLVYIGQVNGVRSLVSQTPSDLRSLPLPGANPAALWMIHAANERYVLLGAYGPPEELWRVDVQALTAERITMVAPAGLALVPYWYGRVQVDSSGGVLQAFDGELGSAMFRSLDLGATWTQLDPFRAPKEGAFARSYAQMIERAGTLLLLPQDQVGYLSLFGPAQVVRPAEALSAEIPMAKISQYPYAVRPALSSDGLCVSYWKEVGEGDRTLTVFDLRSGEETLLGADADAAEVLGDPVWLR